MKQEDVVGNMQIAEEMEILRRSIHRHSYLYYVLSTPEISDVEWDALYDRLVLLEKEYPQLVTEDSPTQIVGGKVLEGFEPVTHAFPLYSLDKESSMDALVERLEAIKDDNTTFVVELKIDGLTAQLQYENGRLVQGATRGNGTVGEDVTENLRNVLGVPLTIPYKGTLFVHGEVFFPKNQLQRVNEERLENQEMVFANTRNAASGTLRQYATEKVKDRKLGFLAYQIQNLSDIGADIGVKTHVENTTFLEANHFMTVESRPFSEVSEVVAYIRTIDRDALPFDIDGMVVKVNEMSRREELGYTRKYPRHSIAFKFETEKALSKVLGISVQVGRTGKLTPVAELEPVSLAQTIVAKATLHNFDILEKMDVRIGDTVLIHKGGDIIPAVLGVEMELRPEEALPYEKPSFCPSCGAAVEQKEGIVDLFCTGEDCGDKVVRQISHFVSRDAMDIDSLGKTIVQQLVDKGYVSHALDLYDLTFEQLMTLDRMGETTANKLLKNIQESKSKQPFSKVLYALGQKEIGRSVSTELVKTFGSLDAILSLSREDIESIKGFGSKLADSILELSTVPSWINTLNRVRELGLHVEEAIVAPTGGVFEGKTVVITGTLSKERSHFAAIVESQGGKVGKSVSSKTDFLLYGEKAGSKLKAATKLVEEGTMEQGSLLTEDAFNALLGN